MQFSDFSLDRRLLQSLAHQGIDTPTPIQEVAIPVALAGKDLMASSQTGSGKTLAFLLPALQRIISTKALSKQDPRVLILLPTRELANQVYAELRSLVANTQYSAVSILGGENFNDQAKALARNPHFIVATPGRLADHLSQRHLFLNGLELLILDEADRMLDLGFAEQLRAINAAADHRRRQTLMFSATLAHEQVQELAGELLKEPRHVAIGASNQANPDIQQRLYLADHLTHKEALLEALLNQSTFQQAIVFTATREDSERIATLVNQWGHSAIGLSGELAQSKRNQIMDDFARGYNKVLVTTDVASRGLDLTNVSLVINFDMPKFAEEYIHRIGRTGRAGAKGDAISLVGPKDWRAFERIEAFLGHEIERATIEGLTAKFTGLAPERKTSAKRPTNKANATKRKASNTKQQKPANRDKRFMTAVDVGDAPMRRKPAKPIDLDNDDE
ncbi:DEAD/DEAH box helicase [Shewanella sp. C32]|uniref:DEAD/DEAH box helicase n=1 Tax=Shewanella electrica TaxID=515560 RepID=A0ABT2FIR9_9GAMM|nr:DEAD/DEAH box helicase [Shewanella electrica]MCH1923458.1 DEAD/DEAH box helicase [Shewanella electrica]MCS4555555.1 DEAD/DEAH box helicase [Shewanella electrica]